MTEGDTVTVMYAILSNVSIPFDNFATFIIEILQGSGSATGKRMYGTVCPLPVNWSTPNTAC